MSKAAFLVLILLTGISSVRAGLSRTYPTSAVTIVRLTAYHDSIKEIWESPFVVDASRIVPISTAPFTVQISSTSGRIIYELGISLEEEIKLAFINQILDMNEQYMVFPATDTSQLQGTWDGLCQDTVNPKVFVDCP